jgi:SWI/SNF-related matrix-associated actin-dependent regulator of chromatin subfamily A-like protein 1
MVRRKKIDVLQDLPPKTRTVLPLDIEDRSQYERAERDLISWLMETNPLAARRARNAEEYAKWTHLKRLACRLKMKRVVEWVKDYLMQSDGKILLGVWHTDTTRRLLHSFGNCSTVIDGSKTSLQRQEAESRFKKDPKCRILIGNYKSAGVGLNLPEADTVGLIEIPWNPATCVQFEDRAHRMNSVNPVSVMYFVAHGTIEEKLCSINDRKMRITDTVLDGVTSQDSSLTIYEELMDALVKVRGKDAEKR